MAISGDEIFNRFRVFDSHFHIIDTRFPLVPNQGYLPDEFACDAYLKHTNALNLCGGAVVSGSFQAYDQSYLLDALMRLGPRFVGVTQLPASVSDHELLALDRAGVRAIRFNIKRGGSEDVGQLEDFARRVYEIVKWHVELYIDSKDLPDLTDTLACLPCVSIDHMGLSRAGFPHLLKLVEKGAMVKATGFGRGDLIIKEAILALYSANPDALIFGTDLPSTRAKRPYHHDDLLLIYEVLGEQGARRVTFDNAVNFYRPRKIGQSSY